MDPRGGSKIEWCTLIRGSRGFRGKLFVVVVRRCVRRSFPLGGMVVRLRRRRLLLQMALSGVFLLIGVVCAVFPLRGAGARAVEVSPVGSVFGY